MITELIKQTKTGMIILLLFTLITGLIYPAAVTLIAQFIFPWKANGSLIKNNNEIVGSTLIGQNFTANNYFWGRPSATVPSPYNALHSAGSNRGPSNPIFLKLIKLRAEMLNRSDHLPVPIELITASGSGLDPDITPSGAFFQIPRVAKERGLSEKELESLIQQSIENRELGILGEPRVNVLRLNILLDNFKRMNRDKITTQS